MTADQINSILKIKESFELPERMMAILNSEVDRANIFAAFLEIERDLSFDWFTDYFQEQHSNRDKMMQDFTPQSLCALLPEIPDKFQSAADICAGTGGLIIGAWHKNQAAFFFCAELSNRAFPLLLFNLAIRNMSTLAVRTDILSKKIFEVFRLTPGEQFSEIEKLDSIPNLPAFDYVMMNPPYSLKFKWDEKATDPRFVGYGYPPSQFSDYAFVLHGLSMLKNGGTLCAILPHGVLFRGNKEAAIRQKLIENKLISAIIGLPDKLFLNTGIPVCVIVLNKSEDVLLVDASREFKAQGKQNLLQSANIEKMLCAIRLRADIKKYAHLANAAEIAENNYNLNISRYVDTYEPPPLPDIVEVTREIVRLDAEIKQTSRELLTMMKDLSAEGKRGPELAECVRLWEEMCDGFAEQRSDAAADCSGRTCCERQDISSGDSVHSGERLQTVKSGTVQQARNSRGNRKQVRGHTSKSSSTAGVPTDRAGKLGTDVHGTVRRNEHQYSDGSVQLLLTPLA